MCIRDRNITDNAWETLIKIQGQVDPKDDDNTIWVIDYKMPEGTALSPYESSQEINLKSVSYTHLG